MNDLVFNYIECREVNTNAYICKIDLKYNNIGIPIPGDLLCVYSEYHGETRSFKIVNRGFEIDRKKILMKVEEIR